MSITLQATVVLDDSGEIDFAGSEAAYRTTLRKFQAERQLEREQIAVAVGALFDEHPGANINMPAVASMAAAKLNAQPENFKVLAARILDYVRSESQGEMDKTTKTVPHPDSLFVIGKGKNGGCYRRADKVAKDAAEAAAKASATTAQ